MSVRKRQWTSPRGEAKEAWVVNYTDGNGTRRLKTFAKKKEADAYAAKTDVSVREGSHIADSASVTVREAGKLWLKAGVEAGLERTTLDQRRQHLDLHLNPFLGDVKLSKLTAPSVRDFQRDLRDGGRTPAMVKRVTTSLGSILGEMLEAGKAVRNPVHELSRSRSKRTAKTDARQKEPLRVGVDIPTNGEIRAILNAASGRYRPFLITAIFTGMRASELRGLSWDAVDLEKATVTVRQRADRYNDMGAPKSKSGYRVIPLPPMVVNTLNAWREDCPKGEAGLVFPNGAGNVEAHPNIVTRGLWPTLLKAGVSVPGKQVDEVGKPVTVAKYTGLHALRHWFASWCINREAEGGQGLTAKAVQERMGHSSITVTMDVYGHLFPAADGGKALANAERALMNVN